MEEAPNAWQDLIKLCEVLEVTPDDQLESELSAILNIDRALWFLALDNVFIDNDGYFSRASDYALYQDPNGRFHLLPHDSNETFRFAGGGGPNSWQTDGQMLSPVALENDTMRPVVRRLFAIPYLRARYLAHVRTIASEWLNWDRLQPIIAEYQSLVDAEVKTDDKKLYAYEAFATSHTKDQGGGGGGPGGRGGRMTPSFQAFCRGTGGISAQPSRNRQADVHYRIRLQARSTDGEIGPCRSQPRLVEMSVLMPLSCIMRTGDWHLSRAYQCQKKEQPTWAKSLLTPPVRRFVTTSKSDLLTERHGSVFPSPNRICALDLPRRYIPSPIALLWLSMN